MGGEVQSGGETVIPHEYWTCHPDKEEADDEI